jgi:hypothetical protein
VAVLFVGAEVEVGAEANDANAGGLEAPDGVEAGGGGFRNPETPARFELVGSVVVELLGGLGEAFSGSEVSASEASLLSASNSRALL